MHITMMQGKDILKNRIKIIRKTNRQSINLTTKMFMRKRLPTIRLPEQANTIIFHANRIQMPSQKEFWKAIILKKHTVTMLITKIILQAKILHSGRWRIGLIATMR